MLDRPIRREWDLMCEAPATDERYIESGAVEGYDQVEPLHAGDQATNYPGILDTAPDITGSEVILENLSRDGVLDAPSKHDAKVTLQIRAFDIQEPDAIRRGYHEFRIVGMLPAVASEVLKVASPMPVTSTTSYSEDLGFLEFCQNGCYGGNIGGGLIGDTWHDNLSRRR